MLTAPETGPFFFSSHKHHFQLSPSLHRNSRTRNPCFSSERIIDRIHKNPEFQKALRMNGAGDSSGSSNNGSMSTVSKAEVVEPELHDYVGLSEVSSYPKQIRVEGEELELGLGLGFGPKVRSTGCRILTAKDFPSMVSSSPSPSHRAGTKRAAESVAQEAGSTSPGQVVGWPPIRAYRMNSMVNQTRASPEGSPIEKQINTSKNVFKSSNTFNSNNICGRGHGKSLFVKVNMDGTPIGRKLDLNAHTCYQTLAQALDDMFQRPSNKCPGGAKEHEVKEGKASKLLDGSSEFVLTYEDKDGDWMLVGDVPWGMFLSTVKRLRIMRTSEVNGLSPRFQDKGDRQRSKPV